MAFPKSGPLLALAIAFAAAFVILGLTFARKPWKEVDYIGSRASGKALPVAIAFTRSGYSPALTIAAIACAAIALALRESLAAPAFVVALQLIGQL
ncbi:MAG: hypothetical protein ACREMT_00715, partial [Vulcanimicrobiaceae bacterium]